MEQIERKISFALINMGVNPAKKGFRLLTETILEYVVAEVALCEIYRTICKRKNITFSNLERSLRTCISELSVDNIRRVVNQLAGCEVITEGACFTVGVFVTLVGEVMRLSNYETVKSILLSKSAS